MTPNEQISCILQDLINRDSKYIYEHALGQSVRWGLIEKDLRKVVEDAVLMERNLHTVKGSEQRMREALENDRH